MVDLARCERTDGEGSVQPDRCTGKILLHFMPACPVSHVRKNEFLRMDIFNNGENLAHIRLIVIIDSDIDPSMNKSDQTNL